MEMLYKKVEWDLSKTVYKSPLGVVKNCIRYRAIKHKNVGYHLYLMCYYHDRVIPVMVSWGNPSHNFSTIVEMAEKYWKEIGRELVEKIKKGKQDNNMILGGTRMR